MTIMMANNDYVLLLLPPLLLLFYCYYCLYIWNYNPAYMCGFTCHFTLFPFNQLFLDALWGFLFAYSFGVSFYIREKIGKMANSIRLGFTSCSYFCIWLGAWFIRNTRREWTVSWIFAKFKFLISFWGFYLMFMFHFYYFFFFICIKLLDESYEVWSYFGCTCLYFNVP